MGKYFVSLLLCFLLIMCAGLTTAGAQEDLYPILVIEQVNMERSVLAGETFYITVVVKNHGTNPAFNVYAEVKSLKERDEFFQRGTPVASKDEPDLLKIDGGETRSLTFPVYVQEDAVRKDEGYNLQITLMGERIDSDASFVLVPLTSASTRVHIDYETTAPNLTVTNVVLDPKTPRGQEPFTAVFYLDNHSKMEARNVNVSIASDDFEVVDVTNRKFLQSVSRGGGDFVIFKLRSADKRASNAVELSFEYDYAGQTGVDSKLSVNLPLDPAAPGTAPLLKIRSFSLERTSRQDEYRLNLLLENLGARQATHIALSFDGGNNIYLIQGSNVDYLPAVEGKEQIELSYLLGINRSQVEGHLPLQVTMTYEDPAGNELTSSETLGIAASQVGTDTTAGEPRVLISKYTLSEEKILAGNIVSLSLFIENTHSRPVRNIKVSLGILMVEETGSSGTRSTGGTVFSPVNSSNSFFIQQIPAHTVLEQSVELLVDPNAAAKTYVVPVTIEYEDQDAKAYKVEEMVNIPVTQESRLQILGIEVPPVAHVGQPAFVSAEFVNVGKVDLGNFIVMMEGNFHKEQASYFVGNLGIGMSDFYQGIIFPENEGTLEGELIFSYLDNNNREVQVVEPFQIQVMPMMEREPFPGEMPTGFDEPGGPGGGGFIAGLKNRLGLIIAIVIAAAVGGFFLRRRILKKRNEEFTDA